MLNQYIHIRYMLILCFLNYVYSLGGYIQQYLCTIICYHIIMFDCRFIHVHITIYNFKNCLSILKCRAVPHEVFDMVVTTLGLVWSGNPQFGQCLRRGVLTPGEWYTVDVLHQLRSVVDIPLFTWCFFYIPVSSAWFLNHQRRTPVKFKSWSLKPWWVFKRKHLFQGLISELHHLWKIRSSWWIPKNKENLRWCIDNTRAL